MLSFVLTKLSDSIEGIFGVLSFCLDSTSVCASFPLRALAFPVTVESAPSRRYGLSVIAFCALSSSFGLPLYEFFCFENFKCAAYDDHLRVTLTQNLRGFGAAPFRLGGIE